MKTFLDNLSGAFNTNVAGYSARKLSAFWIIVLITIIHIWWLRHAYRKDDFSQLEAILLIDFSFVGTALGLTTIETLSKLKNNKPNDNVPAIDSQKI